jgi:Right handed beta helix region
MLKLALAIFFLTPSVTLGANIYIDGQLGANCTSANYSIANRTCTGSNGNAYNNINSALAASAANDTVLVRAGSYTTNVAGNQGVIVKNGQTWQPYNNESVTITGAATDRFVFHVDGACCEARNNITIRGFTVIGGKESGIRVSDSNGTKVLNNNVSGFATDNIDYTHGIAFGDCCGGNGRTTQNGEVSGNTIHDPGGKTGFIGGIGIGGKETSNLLVSNNHIGPNIRIGVHMDVEACNVPQGATACTLQDNYIEAPIRHCFGAEIGSTGIFRRNICDRPGEMAWWVSPRDPKSQCTSCVIDGMKVQNNVIYNPGTGGVVFFSYASGSAYLVNLSVDNNIFYSTLNNGAPLLNVGNFFTSTASNRYRNNLFFTPNDRAVCWGTTAADTNASDCTTAGTIYADTTAGMNSWQSAAPANVASSNIVGNPLFANPSQGDFRLCTGPGTPVSNCTGKSPAIDAGTNLGLSYTGTAPDIGAIESAASTGGALLAPTITSVTP